MKSRYCKLRVSLRAFQFVLFESYIALESSDSFNFYMQFLVCNFCEIKRLNRKRSYKLLNQQNFSYKRKVVGAHGFFLLSSPPECCASSAHSCVLDGVMLDAAAVFQPVQTSTATRTRTKQLRVPAASLFCVHTQCSRRAAWQDGFFVVFHKQLVDLLTYVLRIVPCYSTDSHKENCFRIHCTLFSVFLYCIFVSA